MESRQLFTAADRALRSCSLLRSRIQSLTPALTTPSRTLTTTTPAHQDASSTPRASSPRHASAPPPPPGQVRMPFRLRPAPSQPPFKVNTDASVLDSAYVSLLGRGGDLLLPSDLKWLAVTHKSFDHGWQGNNDRLAFLGKRIVDLQVSLSLVAMPRLRTWGEDEEGSGEQGGAISGLENLTVFAKTRVQDPRRLAGLAREKGLERVVRWKPRKTSDLQSSGVDTVLAHTLYAIVGALSLQRGGDTTTQLVKERILAPLGLRK